jgi:DNA-binding NarL/FixJ family response regulator
LAPVQDAAAADADGPTAASSRNESVTRRGQDQKWSTASVVTVNDHLMTDQMSGLMSPVPERRGAALLALLHAVGAADTGVLTALDSARRHMVVARLGNQAGLARGQITRSLMSSGQYVGTLCLNGTSTLLSPQAVATLDSLTPHAAAVAAAVSRRSALGLTPREHDVLCAIAEGLSNAEISQRDSVSIRTVTTQVESIFRKLAVRNRVQAARIAVDCCLRDRHSQAPDYSAGLTSAQGLAAS